MLRNGELNSGAIMVKEVTARPGELPGEVGVEIETVRLPRLFLLWLM